MKRSLRLIALAILFGPLFSIYHEANGDSVLTNIKKAAEGVGSFLGAIVAGLVYVCQNGCDFGSPSAVAATTAIAKQNGLNTKGQGALQLEMQKYTGVTDLENIKAFLQAKTSALNDATAAPLGPDLVSRLQDSFLSIQSANSSMSISDLQSLCPKSTSIDTFSNSWGTAETLLVANTGQGFYGSDIINMAKNSAYLPDGFNGTLLERITLISNTISANPAFTKAYVVADAFKAAAVAQQNAAISEPGAGPSSGSGPSSGPSSSGTGKASVPSTDTPSAFDTLKASVVRQQATLDKYISQGKAGSETFEAQQASIQQQINTSSGQALELAKAKARQLMTDNPESNFTDENGEPLTVEG